MLLPESIVYAFDWNWKTLSGVKVFCDDSVKETAMDSFIKEFSESWQAAKIKTFTECGIEENEIDSYLMIDAYIDATLTDYGFFIKPYELTVLCSDELVDEPDYGSEAFFNSLKKLRNRFPGLEYDGYIGYANVVEFDTKIRQWEISTIDTAYETKTYDFVGEIIGNELAISPYDPENLSFFWAELDQCAQYGEKLDCFAEIIETLNAYSKWINKEDLERAVKSIFTIAIRTDADYTCKEASELTGLLKKLGVDIPEDDLDYMKHRLARQHEETK